MNWFKSIKLWGVTKARYIYYSILAALILIFAIYVWPTPYIYMTAHGHDQQVIVQIERFTGRTMVFQYYPEEKGWSWEHAGHAF